MSLYQTDASAFRRARRACRISLLAIGLASLLSPAVSAGTLVEFPNLPEHTPANLSGYLARPDAGLAAELGSPSNGGGPFPAVVVLHGCIGTTGHFAGIADRLSSWGYVALAVDSFGPRGISSRCGSGGIEQAFDAYAALRYLSQLDFVDPARVAVLGESLGGYAALYAVERDMAARDFAERLDARRADGNTFPIERSAGRFELLGSEQYAVVMRDITFRREAEARDRQHQAELAHVSRVSLAGEMAAGLAHELSQPLTAIIAYARGCLRLLAGPVPEPALLREGIDEVVQQAERAGDVLGRLREFVRGGEFRRALTEIKPVIDAAVSLVHSEALHQEVEIEATIDPGLPVVLADPVQIEQVLLNLLRNAMDAMEAVNIERRSIIVEARRKGKHAIEIAVADTGPGVASQMTDTIFEPFITTKPLGMGMGLSISRAIIESHGGKLRMAHGTGSGAILIVNLPTAETEASIDAG